MVVLTLSVIMYSNMQTDTIKMELESVSLKGSQVATYVICNSYTMGCPPVRGDNPRAVASGLSYVQEDKHGITILYHLHQCRPSTS